MKKYMVPVFVSLFLGIFMAYFIIHQYESLESITISKLATKVYFIQKSKYASKTDMENDMKGFTNYVFNVEDNMYVSYVGISQDKNNALKIQGVYKSDTEEYPIIEKIVDNSDFIDILSQYDGVLAKTDDAESIKVIARQILSKYEEYVNGEFSN